MNYRLTIIFCLALIFSASVSFAQMSKKEKKEFSSFKKYCKNTKSGFHDKIKKEVLHAMRKDLSFSGAKTYLIEKLQQLAGYAEETFDVQLRKNLTMLTVRHYNMETVNKLLEVYLSINPETKLTNPVFI